MSSILSLLLEPGASTRLVPVINLSLLALIAVLVVVYTQVEGSIRVHVMVMGALAFGLMMSVNWVAGMYQDAKQREQEQQEQPPQQEGGEGRVGDDRNLKAD